MISKVSSDTATSSQATGQLSLVFPEEDLSSFPIDMGKAVVIAMPQLQPPGVLVCSWAEVAKWQSQP